MSEKKRAEGTQSKQAPLDRQADRPVDRLELRKRILSERQAAFHALSKY